MKVDVREELVKRFTWFDYFVFGMMLALSAGIGIFYGCFGKKMKDTKQFLMAGKNMTTFPVAMSLIASFMSAIALLGTPSEVYQNGASYSLIVISYIFVIMTACWVYLPVFWDLQVTSAYEYLERRFNKSVRILGSLLFIAQMCFYMAIVVYAPALALAQVTGVNVYISASLICFVCIFYTTLGGMKAVLWTDALQTIVMYGSTLFIVIKGAMDQGGFMQVWEISKRGNRTEIFNWDPDPRTRHTFWSLVFGGYFVWLPIYGVNQAQVQRYLCVKKRSTAIRALWINCIGFVILILTCSFGGLVIYSKYVDCDPVASKLVSKADQILPFFVMDTLGDWRGLPGLFVAGIFSGALSTISSGMNSLAAITLEDILRSLNPNLTERASVISSKMFSFFYGLLTYFLIFVAEQMGDIVSAEAGKSARTAGLFETGTVPVKPENMAALGIYGLIGGPLLGLFSLGLFFPHANSFGALLGTLMGLSLTLWIGTGFQVASNMGQITFDKLPTNECNLTAEVDSGVENIWNNENNNLTKYEFLVDKEESSGLLELYKLSYMWYSAVGCISSVTIGMILSLMTGKRDIKTLNPKLLSPLVFWFNFLVPNFDQIGINCEERLAMTLNKVESGCTIVDQCEDSNEEEKLPIVREEDVHPRITAATEKTCKL